MDFYKFHKFASLMVDVMFVNGTELKIISEIKQLLTFDHVPNLTANNISNTLNKVIKLY